MVAHRYTLEILDKSVLAKGIVLNVGCGLGSLSNDLSRIGYETVSLDISFEKVRAGKKLGFISEFIIADASHMPFRDSVFGLLLSVSVLTYCYKPYVALQEIARVSKGGSQFLAFEFNKDSLMVRWFRGYGSRQLISLREYTKMLSPSFFMKGQRKLGIIPHRAVSRVYGKRVLYGLTYKLDKALSTIPGFRSMALFQCFTALRSSA